MAPQTLAHVLFLNISITLITAMELVENLGQKKTDYSKWDDNDSKDVMLRQGMYW